MPEQSPVSVAESLLSKPCEPLEACREAAELVVSAMKLIAVLHVDLDGVAAAAVTLRATGALSREARAVGVRGAYRAIQRMLRESAGRPGSVVAVHDLSPQGRGDAEAIASTLMVGRARLLWLDHHLWPSGAREALESRGAIVIHDRSRPTAAIAYSALGRGDEVSRRIALLGVLDDMCANDPEGLVPRWRLVLRYTGLEGAERAALSLAEGDLWPSWAEEVYKARAGEYGELIRRARESTRIYTFDGVRVAILTPDPRLSACDLELWGAYPEDADVIVVVYPRGVSIRTRGGVDASCIARAMGGGGHETAAGAPRPTSMGPAQVARQVAKLAAMCRVGEG